MRHRAASLAPALGLLMGAAACAPLVTGPSDLREIARFGPAEAARRFGDAERALSLSRDRLAGAEALDAEAGGEERGALMEEARDAGLAAALLEETGAEGLILAARALTALAEDGLADGSPEAGARRELEAAVRCARLAAEREPDRGEAAYREGIALGRLAELSGVKAAGSLDEIHRAFETAARLAPDLDRGGPLLALGLFYLRAPGWPSGPGDADLAAETLEEAVRRFPGHPPHRIALARAFREIDRKADSCREAGEALRLARRSEAKPGPGEDPKAWAREAEELLRRCS